MRFGRRAYTCVSQEVDVYVNTQDSVTFPDSFPASFASMASLETLRLQTYRGYDWEVSADVTYRLLSGATLPRLRHLTLPSVGEGDPSSVHGQLHGSPIASLHVQCLSYRAMDSLLPLLPLLPCLTHVGVDLADVHMCVPDRARSQMALLAPWRNESGAVELELRMDDPGDTAIVDQDSMKMELSDMDRYDIARSFRCVGVNRGNDERTGVDRSCCVKWNGPQMTREEGGRAYSPAILFFLKHHT